MERFSVIVTLLLIGYALSYPSFKDVIPNGNEVPHPCKPNYFWHGVGHHNPLGGGDRNPFGIDFKNANYQWTTELCRQDSDGDGMTNGQELGDPNCVWKTGQLPSRLLDITHPGVCTRSDGSICAKDIGWIDCNLDEGLKSCKIRDDPDTRNFTVRFPETAVPKEETSYVCMIFNLPAEDDFHLIAYEPTIDNQDVMHHIILYGCDPNEEPVPEDKLNKVEDCGMGASSKCRTIIGLWAVGFTGYCIDGPMGYPFGLSGRKQAALEFHWNNPRHVETYKDASGMTLYYTPKLRANNAGIMMVGQQYIEIPPGVQSHTVVGRCDESCSRQMIKDKINIFWAFNHMHNLGHAMKLEVYRNGAFYTELTNDPIYNYDSPVEYIYSTAVELLPGDEIVTTCKFKSLSRAKTTFYGDATSDEMCFGFISFYPSENMPFSTCTAWKDISICDLYFNREYKDCSWYNFLTNADNETIRMKNEVKQNCRPFLGCTTECKNTLEVLFAEHPCMKGDIYDFMRQNSVDYNNLHMLEFFAAVDSCKLELAAEPDLNENDNTNGSNCIAAINGFLLALLITFNVL